MALDISLLDYAKFSVPIIGATGAAVVGAVKYGLNGSKRKIEEIHEKVHDIDKRLVRVETHMEIGK